MFDTTFSHPFWDFTVRLYEQQNIKEHCKILQATYGFNINVLFFCCWVAATGGGCLKRQELLQIMVIVERWHHDITLGLQKLRHTLNQLTLKSSQQLCSLVLDNELFSQQIEQSLIAERFVPPAVVTALPNQRIQDAKTNLNMYIRLLNRQIQEADYKLLSQLLETVFTTFM